MKRITVIIFCLMALYTQAQNTFPVSGNVGIGITDPSEKLTIDNGNMLIKTSNRGIIFYGGGEKIIGTADYGIQFQTSSATPRMTILNGGNVGIGTINPSHALSVNGTIQAREILVNASNRGIIFHGGGEKIIGTADYGIQFQTSSATPRMTILNNGNVGIGTASPSQRLAVNGTIQAKEIIVNTGWSDFVFDNNYKLRPLTEVEQFVKTNKHLPEIPSQKEVEKNGVQLGDISSKLLMKIEELTLYMIEMKNENVAIKKEIEMLKKENGLLKTSIIKQ